MPQLEPLPRHAVTVGTYSGPCFRNRARTILEAARLPAGQSRGMAGPAFPPTQRLAVLDFWLGRWSVRTRDGEPAGVDVVEPVLDGYAVLEHWRNVRGVEGKSFFWFDAPADTWRGRR
jgi:hypothetical protein